MHKFVAKGTNIVFRYKADYGGNYWVRNELKLSGEVNISSVFYFSQQDVVSSIPDSDEKISDFTYGFIFAVFDGDYIRISGRILGIENDVLIARDIKLARNLFAAERNISIFGRLSDLLDHSNPIFVGGNHKDAIPRIVFEELLDKFPNSYEMNRYAGARVATVLSQYIDGMEDARGRYEKYLNRKLAGDTNIRVDLDFIKKQEIQKYILIRDLIKDALENKSEISEGEWQKLMMSFLLLLFPKYINILENVTINDYYSNPGKTTHRFIDIALVDTNGNLDVIEVKKPFDDKILRKSQYRNNSIPTSELSGSIMQAEKYLFHLTKWGIKGEEALTARYASDLPQGMTIRISNPKAIIILGRDQIGGLGMTGQQVLDFEVIKRKYANVMDIITYDDILRRLDHTIISLGGAV
jgi:hypothetical protein